MPLRIDAGHEVKPSPKRKRKDSIPLLATNSIFAPDLSSSQSEAVLNSSPTSPSSPPTAEPPLEIRTITPEENVAYTGADSPRSAVARKLEGLDLALRGHGNTLPILNFGNTNTNGSLPKKAKLDPDLDFPSSHDLDPLNLCAGSPTKLKPKPARPKSPPPLPSLPPKPTQDSNFIWWSDPEITGHLGLDPDDDGYGINGVGFRPTPAMAAARSVKRRRQVDEWRSREMREERRRRAESRRRAGSADPGGTKVGEVKRHVRFAS